MKNEYFTAPREHKKRSEYAYKVNKLTRAFVDMQAYYASLDGTTSEIDLKLIKETHNLSDILSLEQASIVNMHELTQDLVEYNKAIARQAAQYDYNSYKNENMLMHEVINYLVSNDYEFDLNYECPQFELVIQLSSVKWIIIRNNGDIQLELLIMNKNEPNSPILLETRNTELVINQIEFLYGLFN